MSFSFLQKLIPLSFRTAPLRMILTILGIVIGVAAVIMVMGIGASAQQMVLSQVEKVGSNLVAILPGASEEDGPPAQAFGIVTTTFTYGDIEALRAAGNVPDMEAISGYVSGSGTLESPSENFVVSFQGVSPAMVEVEDISLQEGRFFEPEEEMTGARVIVLGATRAEEFFPNGDAVGQDMKLNKQKYKVVGVLAERGSTAFASPDTLVYVPLGTAQRELLGIRYVNFARAKIKNATSLEQAMQDIDQILRKRHNIADGEAPDYSVRNTKAALDALTQVTGVLQMFLLLIASVSLLVGGIGIMNSMLIAVSQRIREIGLRKAVGAKRSTIVWQFLQESLLVSGIGGVVGVVFGVLVTWVVAIGARAFGYEWEWIVSGTSIIVGILVACGIGIVFGLYPALKASRVSPLEALRYE